MISSTWFSFIGVSFMHDMRSMDSKFSYCKYYVKDRHKIHKAQ